jgi:hypothetical protein
MRLVFYATTYDKIWCFIQKEFLTVFYAKIAPTGDVIFLDKEQVMLCAISSKEKQ